jgi:hypothetical protein
MEEKKKIELELSEEELKQLDDALTYAYEEKYRHIPGERISSIIEIIRKKTKEIVG